MKGQLPRLERTSSVLQRRAKAHDASHFLLIPGEVVTPNSAEQVAELFAEATRSRRPITFRSGGTSLSGQAQSDSILVDVRKAFRQIEVLDDGQRVRVGPGATLRQVNTVLARYGRKLGPDPASEIAATIGGVIANNSSGMLCGTKDNCYATIESLVMVLPSGRILDTADPGADITLRLHEASLVSGLLMLRRRIRENPETVAEIRRQFSLKNTMGYGVNALLDFHRPIDIARHLLIGSEGTLGFVAQATFKTLPLKPFAATGLAIFNTLEEAAAALPALVAAGFDAIELMDATSLRVAQQLAAATEDLKALSVENHTGLLLELQDASAKSLVTRCAAAQSCLAELPLAEDVTLTTDQSRRDALWKIRKGLYTTVAGNRPAGTAALLEDIAVPIEALAETCRALTALFNKHDYQASVIFGHARDGNLHFMLNEQFGQASSLRRYRRFTRDLVRLVLRAGGTLKAEHGTGRVMAPFVQDQFGDELYEIMRDIKTLFDPAGILNPGVIISNDPNIHTQHLKLAPSVESEVDRCVECGYCEPGCPAKDLTLTPRQRIVLRREIAAHPENVELARAVTTDYEYLNTQTCAVDGMCQQACPLEINTGDLVRRLRAESVSKSESALWQAAARSWGALARLGSAALTTAKFSGPLAGLATRLGRRALGADTVPAYDRSLPRGGKVRRRPRSGKPKPAQSVAAYFPACIQTMFASAGPGAHKAFGEVCHRAGIEVQLLAADGLCCGVPWKSKGMQAGYQVMRTRVQQMLRPQGQLTVVCDAASCTHGLQDLTSELENIQVIDLIEFAVAELLPQLTVVNRIPSIALHPTCSTAELGLNDKLVQIANFIADEVYLPAAWGCCGFAGDRGMLHPELTASATAAEAAELAGRKFSAYASANRTCEIGMSRATGKTWLHIVELLAQATDPANAG